MPRKITSIVGGLQNCAPNISGILRPVVNGFIAETSGSFILALLVSGAATLVGALIYLFGLGLVELIVA